MGICCTTEMEGYPPVLYASPFSSPSLGPFPISLLPHLLQFLAVVTGLLSTTSCPMKLSNSSVTAGLCRMPLFSLGMPLPSPGMPLPSPRRMLQLLRLRARLPWYASLMPLATCKHLFLLPLYPPPPSPSSLTMPVHTLSPFSPLNPSSQPAFPLPRFCATPQASTLLTSQTPSTSVHSCSCTACPCSHPSNHQSLWAFLSSFPQCMCLLSSRPFVLPAQTAL